MARSPIKATLNPTSLQYDETAGFTIKRIIRLDKDSNLSLGNTIGTTTLYDKWIGGGYPLADQSYNTLPGGATSIIGAINLAYNAGGGGGATSDAVLQFIVASGGVSAGQYINVSTLTTNGTAVFTLLGANDLTVLPTAWQAIAASNFRRDVKLYVNGQLLVHETAFTSTGTGLSYDWSRGNGGVGVEQNKIFFNFDLVVNNIVTIVCKG